MSNHARRPAATFATSDARAGRGLSVSRSALLDAWNLDEWLALLTDDATYRVRAEANFVVYRFRRNEDVRQYVGHYKCEFRVAAGELLIAKREAILDAMELASLGAVSFIL